MTRHFSIPAVLTLMYLLVPGMSSAQNITEWSSERRTVLAFKVNPDALQKLLPPGWVAAPSSSPATPGASLNVTMMERMVVLDPQGKPLRTGTNRYLVLSVPARNAQTGQNNTIVVGGLSPDGAGVYSVYLTATTARLSRTENGNGDQQGRVQETWEFVAASGERVDLRIAYQRGPVMRTHAETVVRSAAKPEFQRTYRIDQAIDLVRSANAPDRVEQLSFKAAGPKLASLFDGSEVLLGVSAVPYYVREISIP